MTFPMAYAALRCASCGRELGAFVPLGPKTPSPVAFCDEACSHLFVMARRPCNCAVRHVLHETTCPEARK